LVDANGLPLGTLCVIDRVARELTDYQLLALDRLAGSVSALIQARRGASSAGINEFASGSQNASCSDGGASDLTRVVPPKRILMVDDEAGLRAVGQIWLQSLGYEVMLAGSSAEALNLLEIENFDVLFTDIVMPGGKDGLTLARRAQIINPQIKVLLTSGYAREVLVEATLPGAFLLKPYRRDELKGALDSLLIAGSAVP
jgi:CheY-like chemotaxis protein